MQLYGGTWHAVVANNTALRTDGFIVEGLNHGHGVQFAYMPCYFVETLHNRITEGLTLAGSNGGFSLRGYFNASSPFKGAMAAGMVYRDNFADNGRWLISGAVEDVLIEGNAMVNTDTWNLFAITQGKLPNGTEGNTTRRVFLRSNTGFAAPSADGSAVSVVGASGLA